MSRVLGVVATAVLAAGMLAGCGSSSSDALDETTLQQELPPAIAQHNNGSTLTGVECIQQSTTEFRCSGTFEASQAYEEVQQRGIVKKGWTNRDWQVLRNGDSGPVTYDVTVDQDTGRFIAQPVGG